MVWFGCPAAGCFLGFGLGCCSIDFLFCGAVCGFGVCFGEASCCVDFVLMLRLDVWMLDMVDGVSVLSMCGLWI